MSAAPPRHPVVAGNGMVVSSSPWISTVGREVLASGGNALDATLAMAAMGWVALPGQCGVGGDAFAIVHEPDGTVWTVGGSGFGPDGGELGFYTEQGLETLPLTGALAVAAPGAIGALHALHARGATRTLTRLWAPAADAAENGLACSVKTRSDILDHELVLRLDDGTRSVFLREGRAPQIGERIAQPRLAESIRVLATDPENLYTGELAERSVAALAAAGAPYSGSEWAVSGRPLVGSAITTAYAGHTIHETPLPTPGWMVLHQAGLLDGRLGELPFLHAPAVSAMASAARYAFEQRRDRCATDNDEWQRLLSADALAAARASALGPVRSVAVGAARGDTTSTVAVDVEGRAVSFIHSLAFTFGAAMTVPGTGIVLNNRLARGAYLIDGHPNAVRPRRRPLHTLNAWLAVDGSGRLAHAGNTPGGDGQVQWNMQLLSHLLDHDLDPQEAVSAPRFTVSPGSDANALGAPEVLECESRLGSDVLAELRDEGHPVREVGAYAAGGSALIVSVDSERGALLGGADPRLDGIALGV